MHVCLGPGSSAGTRAWAQLSTAAPCRVLGKKWLSNGPWRTPGAQGASKSPVATLLCEESIRHGRQALDCCVEVFLLQGLTLSCSWHRLYFGVASLMPWLQGNTVPILLCFPCTRVTLSKLPQVVRWLNLLSLNIRSFSHTANKPQKEINISHP